MAVAVAAWTVAAIAAEMMDSGVVVVLSDGKMVGGANGDVVVVFAASGRASEGEGRGGGGEGGGGCWS